MIILALIFPLLAQAGLWAELDKAGVVQRVIVADQAFVTKLGGTWVETSPSGDSTKTKNYARIGDKYDALKKGFVSEKPDAAATLDEATLEWKLPEPDKPRPEKDPFFYRWDFKAKEWVLLPQGFIDVLIKNPPKESAVSKGSKL